MSLPAGQQRVLDGIADALRLSEPRLTTMFAIFTRLASNEPRPGREQLAAPGRLARLMACGRPLRGLRGRPAWRRVVIISQMAVAFVVFGVLIGISSHDATGCAKWRQMRADAISIPHQVPCSSSGPAGSGLARK